jgi:rhodanese-related sulfurtransferase
MFQDLEITPAEVVAMQEKNAPVTLVDVREIWEWEYNRIEGARHLPMGEIEARHQTELSPAEEIVLYCHTGMRSLQAAVWLRQMGYANVRSLAGGINRWADEVSPDMPRY